MDRLRQRHAQAKQADEARNSLIEDLLQKVADMQKTMDRNAFVLVLIDGDCMNFLNELVKQGMTGGDEAAKLLRRAVFDYLRYDEDFKHDHKIVIRVYANLRGLSKTYADKGLLLNATAFADFVSGFNKAHALCDFVDAGNHKEAANTKLKEILSLHVYNVHCKQIIFGASADNGYASFLSSFFIDTDVSSRIRLLKGPPFSFEFKNIISRFRWTEFKTVFRSEFIGKESMQPWRRSQDVDQLRSLEPSPSITNNTSSTPWRPKKNADLYAAGVAINKAAAPVSEELIDLSSPKPSETDQDSDGNGVDVSADLHDDQSLASSTAASGQLTPPRSGESPTAMDVEAALISSTNQRLRESPMALDFGVVKQRVEQELGLTPDFWGKDEHDEWFLKSKKIIKMAIEDWVERTDNPPPKNATWMLRFFTSTEESPSSIMRNPSSMLWRTRRDPGFYKPNPAASQSTGHASTDQPTDRAVSDYISQNFEGLRIDMPTELHVNPTLINALRDREPRFCNAHHLVRGCTNPYCSYDHDSVLNEREFEALLCLSRSQRCPQGSACTWVKCTKGHMCPNGRNCKFGNSCKFADLHGIDTEVAREVMES